MRGVLIPRLTTESALRYIAVCGIFFTLAGCGSGNQASITVGAEGFEPAIVEVPAGESFDLEVVNDTQAVQTVVVENRPPLRVAAGETSSRQIDSLPEGDHRVTLEGAPFQATLRAGG